MKQKIFVLVMLLAILAFQVKAQYIQSLDCTKFLNESTYSPKADFNEPANICFYGSGFTASSATLLLVSEDKTYTKEVAVNKGIISSAGGNVKSFFSDVYEGVYNLVVSVTGKKTVMHDKVTVIGGHEFRDEELYDNEHEDKDYDDGNNGNDVPEFSTVAAGALLACIGLYTYKKRKSE